MTVEIRTLKAPNGAGSVEVLPDGRARIRVVIDGKRHQIGPVYPDEATALRMLRAWNAERGEGRLEAASTVTLASFGAEWLDAREISGSRVRAKVKSIRVERSIWSRHVATSELGRMALPSIRPRDVDRFATWLRDRRCVSAVVVGSSSSREVRIRDAGRELSRSMQTHALRLVRGALDEAVRREVLERNPAGGAVVAKGARAPRDLSDQWLRADEIDRLLSCEGIPLRNRAAFACALGLALRLSDVKRLEVAHVHLDCHVPGPHVLVEIGKSSTWHRVPIMPWLAPWLRAHLATLPGGSRYVFPALEADRSGRTAYGASYDFAWGEKRSNAREREKGALERAGVARRVRFHDLRGTTATHLALGTWGRRWSLHEIQSMLAHSEQRVTERYVRRALDTLLDAAKATPGGPGCPGLPMAISNSPTSPAGFEPATFRLGSEGQSEQSRTLTSVLGNAWATAGDGDSLPPSARVSRPLADLARALVLGPSNDAARALADAFLEADDGARLALAAREGGPHALRRAIELAALILERAARAEPTGGTGEGTG